MDEETPADTIDPLSLTEKPSQLLQSSSSLSLPATTTSSSSSQPSGGGDDDDDGDGDGAGGTLLRQVQREYLLCKPPSRILSDFLNPKVAGRKSTGRSIYSSTLGRTDCAEDGLLLQPPVQYRISFVKYIIKQLESGRPPHLVQPDKDDEEEDEDEYERWYRELESLSGMEHQSEPFYRLYQLPENHGWVKIFENEAAFVAEGTTGLVTWEASLELVKWLSQPGGEGNEDIRKRNWVVELGSGCGLLVAAVIKMFPHLSKYIATDGELAATAKCRINLDANVGTLKADVIQVEVIDWVKDGGKFSEIVGNLRMDFGPGGGGLLLGADIVFDPVLVPSLVDLIESFLYTSEGAISFIACTIRIQETVDLFKSTLECRGLKVREVLRWGNNSGVIFKIGVSED